MSEECNGLPDIDAKVEWTVGKLEATGMFTNKEDLHAAVSSFWFKLKMSSEYKPAKKLECPQVQLFKASETHIVMTEGLGADYGLGDVCTATVQIHNIKGDHDTFIQGASAKAIAKIMNSSL